MADFLEKIAGMAADAIARGYYRIEDERLGKKRSLAKKIRRGFGIMAELKHRSPTEPCLFEGDAPGMALRLQRAGACALSLITEPAFFGGSLDEVTAVRRGVGIPVLVKDFVVGEEQIEAADRAGADVLLLIAALFERGLASMSLKEAIDAAHARKLEVLLEVHSLRGFRRALRTEAELIGINNRDFATMQTDLATTLSIIGMEKADRPVISMSGVRTREDVVMLREAGASAVLVGTALHKDGADAIEKLEELIP